jgi:WD40 repeat protein
VAGHYWYIRGTALAVSHDGQSVAVGYDHGAVFIYDIEDGTEQARTYLPSGVAALAFMTDDERLLIGSTKGHVRIVYRRPHSEVVRLQMGARVGTVAMCTNVEGFLFAAGSDNGKAVLVNDSQEHWDERDGAINAIGIDAGGRYLAAGGDDGLCLVFDTRARQKVGYTDHRPQSVGVEPVELGHDVVALPGIMIAFHSEGLREVFDRVMERNRIKRRTVHSVSISDDGRRILTGGADGTIQVLDPVRGVQVGRFDMGAPVDVAAISPSGALAAVAYGGDPLDPSSHPGDRGGAELGRP